jgi:glucokinase
MPPYAIGIDLGGTQLRGAIIDNFGTIVEECKVSTEADKGPQHVINKMKQMISQLLSIKDVIAIGIGSPGPLHNGVVHLPPNLPDWNQIPLVDLIYQEFDLPVYLDNDANVAALAEACLGVESSVETVFYLTISTGIGGGYVINRQLIRGAMNCAGEVGNLIISSSSSSIGAWNVNSFESLASGTAIARQGEKLLKTKGGAKEVFQLAEQGNESALHIIDEHMFYLAVGLSNIIHSFNPHQIILGGGVMQSYEKYLTKLIMTTDQFVYPQLKGTTQITLARLGSNSGVIGAALLTGIC